MVKWRVADGLEQGPGKKEKGKAGARASAGATTSFFIVQGGVTAAAVATTPRPSARGRRSGGVFALAK